MSLFGSLTTAVSGLSAQQDALGNVSDNIANSQTVGYKGADTSFEELVTLSNSNYNAPGGVLAAPVYTNNIAGTLTQSQTATNLAVSGNGFFVVKAPPAQVGSANPVFAQGDLYTRRGDFQIDKNGYLVNGAGDYLEGYGVNPQTGTTDTSATAPIQISQLINNPVQTSNVKLAANLPAGYAVFGSPGYTSPAPVTEQIYDSEGVAHTFSIQFDNQGQKTVGGNVVDQWTATVTAPGLTLTGGSPITLNFSTGTSGETAAGTLLSVVGSSTFNTVGAAASPIISFQTAAGAAQSINLNIGSIGSTQGITQYAGTEVDTQTLTQDGIPRGSFQNVSIDDNGNVTINYTNGQALTYFQIPLAQFNAAQNLAQQTGGSFLPTLTSGSPILGVAGQSGAGTIAPSTLESSNIDIATEFTKLIVAQQAYSANSKVITTADTLIQELLQIIQ